MAYRIHCGEDPNHALCRIAREQIERALAELDDPDLGVAARVHAVRKRCKKIRGLLRLVRPAFPDYGAENRAFRDAARRLSALRDAEARLESFEALVAHFEGDLPLDAFPGVRAALEKLRYAPGDPAHPALGRFRDDLEAALDRAPRWRLETTGFEAVGAGFEKVYRRARRARRVALAEPTTENLHEWRKRVKYHRYHLRLVREAWPRVLGPMRDAAELLSDRLGDDHDLAVLRAFLAEPGEAAGVGAAEREALTALIDSRRAELQAWSVPLGRRLLAGRPRRVREGLGQLWRAGEIERHLATALPARSREVS